MLAFAVPADRDYALQELTAFYLSWLHGLSGAVYNPPIPQGLAGRWRHVSEWIIAAHEAGFTVPDWRQDGNGSGARAPRAGPAAKTAGTTNGSHVIMNEKPWLK